MNRSRSRHPIVAPLAEFLRTEVAGGVVLLGATVVALVWANAAPGTYDDLWHFDLTIGITEDLRHWVNDGLMALFFFVVGLEIKRELTVGELRDRRVAVIPIVAAIGGMVVPALVFLAWNAGSDAADGWGIPMATDIAFAIGVLALLGSRCPPTLKLFVLTLAIVDDIGAIAVIAVFYSDDIDVRWLLGALAIVLLVMLMRRARVETWTAYVVPAVALWFFVLESGVHATIAGVVLGFLTPATGLDEPSPLERLEHWLHTSVSFLVVPLFALANAGVAIGAGARRDAFGDRVTWGVLTGLVVGKLVGVAGAALLAVRLGLGRLPTGMRVKHLIGAAALAGIGFTVALFVSELAFLGMDGTLHRAKIGVLVASASSALLGAAILSAGKDDDRDRADR